MLSRMGWRRAVSSACSAAATSPSTVEGEATARTSEPGRAGRAPRWSARSPPPGPRARSPAALGKSPRRDEGDAKRARSKPSSRLAPHGLRQTGRLDDGVRGHDVHVRAQPAQALRRARRGRGSRRARGRARPTTPSRAKASTSAAAPEVACPAPAPRGPRGTKTAARRTWPAPRTRLSARGRPGAARGRGRRAGRARPRRRWRSSAPPTRSAPAPRAPRRGARCRAAPRSRSRGLRGRTRLSPPAAPRAARTGPGAA